MNPEDVPEDCDTIYLIVFPPAPNAELKLQEGVRVLIGDGHHHYEAIVEFYNDSRPMFE